MIFIALGDFLVGVWFSVIMDNIFLDTLGCFLVCTSAKKRIKCLAQGHNTVPPVRLEPATPLSQVVHSTTESLRSSSSWM